MREIKFRAWNEDYKEMYYKDFDDSVMPENASLFHTGLDSDGNLFAGSYLENGDYVELTLMQYTGLKDKNGKEIFESDILQTTGLYQKNFIVEYTYRSFELYDGKDGVLFEPHLDWSEFKVIGNIYENPELLT